MLPDTFASKILGSLIVLSAVLMSTGCLDRTPKQSGVFVTDDGGEGWRAAPDLAAPDANVPDAYPPLEVTAVGASAEAPDRVFAGTEDDLYRSTDAGRNWEEITGSLPQVKAVAVRDISIDPRAPGTVFVAGVSEGYGKVFRSTDEGKSFEAVFTGSVPGQAATAVAFGPDTTTVFVGDQEGNVYRSRDRGDSWQRVFSTESVVTSLAATGPHLFAGTLGSGVFYSPNTGDTFTPVNTGLPTDARSVWSMAVGNGGLYLGTEEGLFLTKDFGRSWRNVGNPLPEVGGRIQAVAAAGSQVFFGTNAVVYKVTPSGDRFVPRQLRLARNVTDLVAVSPERLYAGAHHRDFNFSERFVPGLPEFNLNSNRR